jgi:DNA transformation protein
MFGLLADDVAYLKVGEANRQDFEKAGSRPFQPFKEKNLTMSYYEIPGEVLEDRDELARWAKVGLLVAQKPGK